MAAGSRGREYLFEFQRSGGYVRVCVLDAQTGLETAVIGPASATQSQLEDLAIRKLEYLRRRQQESETRKPTDRGWLA